MTEQRASALTDDVKLSRAEHSHEHAWLSGVQAVLFDIDGTLVDSTAALERTWTVWAGRHGLDVRDILRVCHGRRSEDTIAEFITGARERATAVVEMEELELGDLDGVVALPGAHELLHSLQALPGQRWAAVTSGSRRLMQARLTAARLPIPAVLIAADDVRQGKPDPEGYLAAAQALNADPERCVVVEDAPAGLEAGRRAGAFTMAVCTSHSADKVAEADLVVANLAQVAIEVQDGQLSLQLQEPITAPRRAQ